MRCRIANRGNRLFSRSNEIDIELPEALSAYHVVLAVQAFAHTRRAGLHARFARPGPLRCDVNRRSRRQFACVTQDFGHEKHDRSPTTSDGRADRTHFGMAPADSRVEVFASVPYNPEGACSGVGCGAGNGRTRHCVRGGNSRSRHREGRVCCLVCVWQDVIPSLGRRRIEGQACLSS